jgi:hypothetical protein
MSTSIESTIGRSAIPPEATGRPDQIHDDTMINAATDRSSTAC